MAFVDDYSAWVAGPTAAANQKASEAIVERALEWERRSEATFEGEKTVLVDFTRDPRRDDMTPILVRGKPISPTRKAKILGVIMDSAPIYGRHRQCGHERAEGGPGPEATVNDLAFDSKAVVRSDGDSHGRLCLEHLASRMWKFSDGGSQPGAENGSASRHGDVSYSGNRRRGSRRGHTDGGHAA